MSNVIGFPQTDVEYILNSTGEIVESIIIDLSRLKSIELRRDESDEVRGRITGLCIAWLALENPEVLNFDDELNEEDGE
jgi:hypothetical protein